MANRHRAEFSINLLGREWILRLTFEALASIEDRLGVGIGEVVLRFHRGGFGVRDVASVIHAGIAAAQDDAPDFESLCRAVVDEGFGVCAMIAGQALAAAMAAEPEATA